MQFLKTLFWVVVAIVMVLFARDNWRPVEIHLWAGLVADIKLPILVLIAFLIGLLPTLIMYRARLWSLRRRLDTQGGSVANGPVVVPVPVPKPVRTSSAPVQRDASEREATDAKAWPTG